MAGRYRLAEIVGRGGMGQVWSAYDKKLGRQVALKIVDLDRSEASSARGRFAREAALSQQLRGPSFVEVYDQGMVGDQAFLVMELLVGETLHERLHRVGTMSPEELLPVVRSIAGCLRLAHALQIVHRDLKPGNVFFARVMKGRSGVQPKGGGDEVVKLIDFGIAKDSWDDARLTRPGLLLGSTFYMSPEQIRSGHDVDGRTDLWALAVIMYRALTGERPFSGAAADAMAKILARDPAVPSSLNPALTPWIDAFFLKALEKDPTRRFQTIDELVDAYTDALRGAADAEPISADGSSVLAAIERLGPLPSSRPPRPEAPAHAVAPRLDAQVSGVESLPSAWLRARRRLSSKPPKNTANASAQRVVLRSGARWLAAVALVAMVALLVLALYASGDALGWGRALGLRAR